MISWKNILAVVKPNVVGALILSIPAHQYPHCVFPQNHLIGSQIQENSLGKKNIECKNLRPIGSYLFSPFRTKMEWNCWKLLAVNIAIAVPNQNYWCEMSENYSPVVKKTQFTNRNTHFQTSQVYKIRTKFGFRIAYSTLNHSCEQTFWQSFGDTHDIDFSLGHSFSCFRF